MVCWCSGQMPSRAASKGLRKKSVSSPPSPTRSMPMRRGSGPEGARKVARADLSKVAVRDGGKPYTTYSTDEPMKSYEVIRSIVARHSRYDAARILTLNLATCITDESKQDETAVLARLADSIRTLCNAVTDMMIEEDDPDAINALLTKRTQTMN